MIEGEGKVGEDCLQKKGEFLNETLLSDRVRKLTKNGTKPLPVRVPRIGQVTIGFVGSKIVVDEMLYNLGEGPYVGIFIDKKSPGNKHLYEKHPELYTNYYILSNKDNSKGFAKHIPCTIEELQNNYSGFVPISIDEIIMLKNVVTQIENTAKEMFKSVATVPALTKIVPQGA